MIEFKDIQLQVSSKRFTKQSRKMIRVSYKNSISSSKQPNVYINETTIKWGNPLQVSGAFNEDIDFQIYDKHEFGYNPQEIQTLLYGTMKVGEAQKIGKFPVYSSGEDHKKVGSLMVTVGRGRPDPSKNASLVNVSSVLVRKLKEPFGKGYMVIKMENKKVIRTASVEPISGEYLFLEEHHLGEPSNGDTLVLELYSGKGDILKGRAEIELAKCGHSNRLELLSGEGSKFAEIYFELQGHKKNNNSTLYNNKSQQTLYKMRSQSESRLTGIFSSTNTLENSRKKKISVVHNNGDVVFPHEKRFQVYQDKQTNVISYSKLSSMKFFDPNSKKYYKGASFGKGEKTDFTNQYKQNPGVGNYRLPSIFDRY